MIRVFLGLEHSHLRNANLLEIWRLRFFLHRASLLVLEVYVIRFVVRMISFLVIFWNIFCLLFVCIGVTLSQGFLWLVLDFHRTRLLRIVRRILLGFILFLLSLDLILILLGHKVIDALVHALSVWRFRGLAWLSISNVLWLYEAVVVAAILVVAQWSWQSTGDYGRFFRKILNWMFAFL